LIELLVDLLPTKVGSVLSINSLKEDIGFSPNTVSRWIQVLEMIYYCYRIAPYGLQKYVQLYLWDWAEVENPGARFENMVASHLLKYCHFHEDNYGHKMELRFIRDVDLREIDFVVLKNNRPLFAVECKTGERKISPHLYYYKKRTSIPQFYQVHMGEKDYADQNIRVLPFSTFCKLEKIP